jgi:type IV secretory pathway VirB6-like protein
VIAIHQQRIAFLVSLAFVAAVTVFAAATVGIVEATAFAPLFLGMVLLERKRSK